MRELQSGIHLSKSILAPDEIATYVHPSTLFSFIYLTIPAIARAPAGSSTHRVSLNPILIAAQISSEDCKSNQSEVHEEKHSAML